MAKTTPATRMLDHAGISYTLHTYTYDPRASKIGRQAAEAIGVSPSRVFKTLMARVDDKAVCVLIPSDREASMKKLASVFGGRAAHMMRPEDAERFTGYHVGGISPLGQKRMVPTAIDETVLGCDTVFINGGQRGIQVELIVTDLVTVLDAPVVSLTAEN